MAFYQRLLYLFLDEIKDDSLLNRAINA